MSLTLSAITLDSANPDRTARFWAEVLGGEVADGGNGYLHVRNPSGLLIVQPAGASAVVATAGVHLDLRADDRDLEVERVVGLGSSVVAERSDSHGAWTVLQDPDGREFCIG